ncbi:MAG: SMC-Scp complex subunit ScpB [Alphaproteobacteria bacterium]|nr:SMC-Scp complex subunit ScpB [Alphaproteobacteria bacterium]
MPASLDRDLADLDPPARWREWMGRVEAAVFAAPEPVGRATLSRLVGEGCDLDRLIQDIRGELEARPYDMVPVAGGWQHRTRPRFAGALRHAEAAPRGQSISPVDAAVLAAIAWHQPITRAEIDARLGRDTPPDTLARLRGLGLIGNGPRSPRPGSPPTYVTTRGFLSTFGLSSHADLPELEPDDLNMVAITAR